MPKQDSYEVYRRIKDLLNTKYFTRYKILIPSEVSAKMELAYYFVADNDIELSFFVGFMVSFGIEVIFEVIESGHIRDMFHLIKFMKRMKKSLREYVEFNKDTYPLIRIDEMHLVMREFHMRGFTYQEQVKFYEWLKDNAITLFEDRIVLDKEHIENMFAQYEMSKMQIRRTV